MQCAPEQRPLSDYLNLGIVVVDKPSGPTSHQVSGWVRDILHLKKAGHFGTLDPKVVGVLPVALGRATRLSPYFMKKDKEYVGIMHLHSDVGLEELKKVFSSFVGKIKQLPPVRSAVARRVRYRNVYEFDLLEMDGRDVLFRVVCEAGTYIRKLCHDVGRRLGIGAHMTELRRTRAGVFHEKDVVTLQDLSDAYWLAVERGDESEIRRMVFAVESVLPLKRIWLLDSAVDPICHGLQLARPGILRYDDVKKGEMVALMTQKGELVAVAEMLCDSDELNEMEKGIVCKTETVIMPAETYPHWKKGEE